MLAEYTCTHGTNPNPFVTLSTWSLGLGVRMHLRRGAEATPPSPRTIEPNPNHAVHPSDRQYSTSRPPLQPPVLAVHPSDRQCCRPALHEDFGPGYTNQQSKHGKQFNGRHVVNERWPISIFMRFTFSIGLTSAAAPAGRTTCHPSACQVAR